MRGLVVIQMLVGAGPTGHPSPMGTILQFAGRSGRCTLNAERKWFESTLENQIKGMEDMTNEDQDGQGDQRRPLPVRLFG